MNRILRILFLVITIISFGVNAYAQKDSRQRLTREQLAEAQAKYISKEMAMDNKTAENFIKIFCQFQKDVWALGPRPKRISSHLSEKEAEQAMHERFAHSQKILNLRKKYYLKYSKFLTPSQIERVYELERIMMNRLFRRSNKK